MRILGSTPEDRLEQMLIHWGMVLAHRGAGGAGYPKGQSGGARGRIRGHSSLVLDYLAIERALREIADAGVRNLVTMSLEAEFTSYAAGRPFAWRVWADSVAQMERPSGRREAYVSLRRGRILAQRWKGATAARWFR